MNTRKLFVVATAMISACSKDKLPQKYGDLYEQAGVNEEAIDIIQSEGEFAAAIEIAQNLEDRSPGMARALYERIFLKMCIYYKKVDPKLFGRMAAIVFNDDPDVAMRLSGIASLTSDEIKNRRHELFAQAHRLASAGYFFHHAAGFIARRILDAFTDDGERNSVVPDLYEDIELMLKLTEFLGEKELHRIWELIAGFRYLGIFEAWHLHDEIAAQPHPPCVDIGHLDLGLQFLQRAEDMGGASTKGDTCKTLDGIVDKCLARLTGQEPGYISTSGDTWPEFSKSARVEALERLQAYTARRCRKTIQ